MQKFKSIASAQQFLTSHAAIYNTFYTQPHLAKRATMRLFREDAFRAWSEATDDETSRERHSAARLT